MLLKALEVQEIEELMEKPSPYLVSVGLEIAKAARLGAPFLSASNKSLHSDMLGKCRFYTKCRYRDLPDCTVTKCRHYEPACR